MNAQIRIIALLLVWFLALEGKAGAADFVWSGFETLKGGDRQLAEGVMADMFGEDPDLWPDWLDPRAVLIPASTGSDAMLVVREPYRAPCGQYMFIVLSPVGRDGTRSRWGDGFCAGALSVQPVKGQRLPDLIFTEGRQRDPQNEGVWRPWDQRVRWIGTNWVRLAS